MGDPPSEQHAPPAVLRVALADDPHPRHYAHDISSRRRDGHGTSCISEATHAMSLRCWACDGGERRAGRFSRLSAHCARDFCEPAHVLPRRPTTGQASLAERGGLLPRLFSRSSGSMSASILSVQPPVPPRRVQIASDAACHCTTARAAPIAACRHPLPIARTLEIARHCPGERFPFRALCGGASSAHRIRGILHPSVVHSTASGGGRPHPHRSRGTRGGMWRRGRGRGRKSRFRWAKDDTLPLRSNQRPVSMARVAGGFRRTNNYTQDDSAMMPSMSLALLNPTGRACTRWIRGAGTHGSPAVHS
ncbi:hypothetical protein C8R45DRAFT_540232 [Mycena sanguinolenta]|nr:hypothetical protein C8R45DRAFT_540232 [Mycena sanguinolenta]